MHSRIEIDVNAPAQAVFELARDVTRWPHLLPHYRKVTVLSHDGDTSVATMRAVRPVGPLGIPVAWRSRVWSDARDPKDLRLRFVHVRGATRGMDVTWHIKPRDGGCRVAIEHDFSRPLPLLGADVFPALIDSLFIRPIARRTLATFKRLAESGEKQ